jgi:hypothetical protein
VITGYTGPRAIAVGGNVVSVLTSIDASIGYVEYYEIVGGALSHYAWAAYTANTLSAGSIVLDLDRTVIQGGGQVSIAQPGESLRDVQLSGTPRRPLRTEDGWFVPTTSTGEVARLYMLDAGVASRFAA